MTIGTSTALLALCFPPIFNWPAPGRPAPLPHSDEQETYTERVPETLVKFDMVKIPGGKVKIGDKVVEVKPFFIGKTEATWEMFDAFAASGPPSPAYDQTEFGPDAIARPSKSYILPDLGWGHRGFPIINSSSTNAMMMIRWVAQTTGKKYRMPTEAEWELAARAGMAGDWKISSDDLGSQAWFKANSDEMTKPVAQKTANAFGLFDMLGNAGEWATDMEGKPVLCGGSFELDAGDQTPMKRRYYEPWWQETDPQIPKSRWWLSDSPFCGIRLVCEP